MRFAENLGAKIVRLNGKDIARAVAAFAREYKITQIIFGRSAVRGWQQYLYLNAIQRFLREAPAVDVHIVNQESR
jgi:two-component system sensor histidine kinase KdpD